MMSGSLLRVTAIGLLAGSLIPGNAVSQDQLSSAFGAIAGGDAVDSFVVISGTVPGSFNEVALATIDSIASVIECVHVAGVISFPASDAVGPTGTLVVQGGGTLATNLVDLGSGAAGHGVLVVRGQDSKVLENEVGDPNCAGGRTHNSSVVGSRGSGSLVVADGAEFNSVFIALAPEAGSSGSVRVESPDTCDAMAESRGADCAQVNLLGVSANGDAAFFNVGRVGYGQLFLKRGRVLVSLNGDSDPVNPDNAGQGFNIGRGPGAVGSVVLSDQSRVLIESTAAANDLPWTTVGRSGTGSLEISGGSLFWSQGTNGVFFVGRDPGSVGTLTLKDAGSTLTVEGLVGLSRDFFDNDGGVSLVTIDAGTVLNAGEIDARANSTIFSAGEINLTNGAFTMAGVFNPGFSPGTATINGNLNLTTTGLLRLEILGPGGADGTDKLVVNGNLACEDCTVQIALLDGATIDDVSSADLLVVNGTATGTGDVEVVDDSGQTVAAFRDIAVSSGGFSVQEVLIDIKPDSTENTVNLGSNGVLPVVVFSAPGFDATAIDPATVRLSSAEIRLRGNGSYLTDTKDVNGDGLLDLTIKVDTSALELTETSETAQLTGQTTTGALFHGSDIIRVVPEGG